MSAEKTLVSPRIEARLRPTEDPLGETLRLLKLNGVLYCRAELSAPWGIDLPRIPGCMMIQIVVSGGCWLDIAGQPTRRLEAGSLAMMPHGTPHQIRSAADAEATPLTDIPVERVTDRYEIMQHGGGGDTTRITYCGVRFDHQAAQRLLQLLPLVIQVDTLEDTSDWLGDTVRFIAREAEELRPGSETIITRLADIVVVQAIRSWLAAAREDEKGWLAALRDPQLGRAMTAIHRDPSAVWNLVSLANEANMSRSGFAARFNEIVGQPAMQYVTEWRMQLARTDLRDTGDPLALIAERYGYQSEAAFSRAYKRVYGVPPGTDRRLGTNTPA